MWLTRPRRGKKWPASCARTRCRHRVSRVLIGQTRGLYDPRITPESVRDHHDLIADEDGYIVPVTARDIGTFETAHPVPGSPGRAGGE